MKRPLTPAEKRIVLSIHSALRRTSWTDDGKVRMEYVIGGETRCVIASDVMSCCLFIKGQVEAEQ